MEDEPYVSEKHADDFETSGFVIRILFVQTLHCMKRLTFMEGEE